MISTDGTKRLFFVKLIREKNRQVISATVEHTVDSYSVIRNVVKNHIVAAYEISIWTIRFIGNKERRPHFWITAQRQDCRTQTPDYVQGRRGILKTTLNIIRNLPHICPGKR